MYKQSWITKLLCLSVDLLSKNNINTDATELKEKMIETTKKVSGAMFFSL